MRKGTPRKKLSLMSSDGWWLPLRGRVAGRRECSQRMGEKEHGHVGHETACPLLGSSGANRWGHVIPAKPPLTECGSGLRLDLGEAGLLECLLTEDHVELGLFVGRLDLALAIVAAELDGGASNGHFGAVLDRAAAQRA